MEYSRLFLVVLSCLCFDPMAMADLETVRAQFQHRNVPGPATSRAFDTVWICGYQPRTRLGDQDRESSHAPLPNNIANGSNGMHRSGWKKTVELRAIILILKDGFRASSYHIKVRRSGSSAPRGGKKEEKEESPPSHSIPLDLQLIP